jgi:hypothetical protein
MTLIAMVSAKGSPGVSTAALACTLTWPASPEAPVLLAECDPAGGALLAGHLSRYDLPTDRGILPLAGAALRGTAEKELPGLLIDLDAGKHERLALTGLSDPAQGASLHPAWGAIGEVLTALSHAGWTVLADCGRLASAYPPWPLLRQADVVLLALNTRSLATISPAVPALAALRRELAPTPAVLGLLPIGDGTPARELSRHLMAPIAAEIAGDSGTAAVLGGQGRGRRRGSLLRSAARAQRTIEALIAADRGARVQLLPAAITSSAVPR